MIGIYDGYGKIDNNKITYFAGANTGDGFVGSYADIANENKLERVYIIKGGPGSGKSTMMCNLAKTAENSGYPVEYYLCGSDPYSLDCVVIDNKITVLDGTFPHVKDMKYPGAKSTIVDLTKCWSDSVLEARNEEIINLAAGKSVVYASAYRYLKAADQIELDSCGIREKLFDSNKANAFATRFTKKLHKPYHSTGEIKHRYTSGITMRGAVRVQTLSDLAKTRYFVKDSFGTSADLMKLIYEKLKFSGYSLTVGHIPLVNTISEIYIEDASVTISALDLRDDSKIINAERFIFKDLLPKFKGNLKLSAKCREECVNAAKISLKSAAEYHFALEKIYVTSMDFEKLDAITTDLKKDILKRLR